jgi:AcrR family transcriptional regulator
MSGDSSTQSARQRALLEQAYQYALQHGLTDLSLRPLATAIGSSPRVLLFLFGSKDGLIRALLSRARADELTLLHQLHNAADDAPGGLAAATERVWSWLAAEDHRALLTLWVEGYARSLTDPDGAWSGFAETTVEDWLGVLGNAQPAADRNTTAGRAQRTLALAVLRGALLDLLATGDIERTTAAVRQQLDSLCRPFHSPDDR